MRLQIGSFFMWSSIYSSSILLVGALVHYVSSSYEFSKRSNQHKGMLVVAAGRGCIASLA